MNPLPGVSFSEWKSKSFSSVQAASAEKFLNGLCGSLMFTNFTLGDGTVPLTHGSPWGKLPASPPKMLATHLSLFLFLAQREREKKKKSF